MAYHPRALSVAPDEKQNHAQQDAYDSRKIFARQAHTVALLILNAMTIQLAGIFDIFFKKICFRRRFFGAAPLQ